MAALPSVATPAPVCARYLSTPEGATASALLLCATMTSAAKRVGVHS